MSGRVGGIRKGLDPRFDGGCWGKVDTKKKVSTSAVNPWSSYQTTRFERSPFIVQMVDDEIEYLWWEEGGGHGCRFH